MTDRPDIPEEVPIPEKAIRDALKMYENSGVLLTSLGTPADNSVAVENMLKMAAPALRKQGAEEERERLRGTLTSERALSVEGGQTGFMEGGGYSHNDPVKYGKRLEGALRKAVLRALDTPAPSEPEEDPPIFGDPDREEEEEAEVEPDEEAY